MIELHWAALSVAMLCSAWVGVFIGVGAMIQCRTWAENNNAIDKAEFKAKYGKNE